MAEILKNTLLFLLGFIILPRIVLFISILLFIFLGFEMPQILIFATIIDGIVVFILFFISKPVAIGYLFSFIISLIVVFFIMSGNLEIPEEVALSGLFLFNSKKFKNSIIKHV